MSIERVRSEGGIPALWTRGSGERRAAVLLLHGYAASKESHAKELGLLEEAGFAVLAPDAPGHGERADGRVEVLEAGPGDRWHEGLLEIVAAQAEELPALTRELQANAGVKVAAVGISMGACVALWAQGQSRCFGAVASLLGTPELTPRGEALQTERLSRLLAAAPAGRLEAFAGVPLLLANGGQDVQVPPQASQRFSGALRDRYGAAACEYLEYPQSGHFMRAEDWDDLWGALVRFLSRL